MKKIALLIFLFSISTSFACSCIGKSGIRKEIKSTDVIVLGKVIKKSESTFQDPEFPEIKIQNIMYEILITKKFKGKVETDYVTIFSGVGNGDCGINLEIGKEYIIYANQTEYLSLNLKLLETNICTRTKLSNPKEVNTIDRISRRKGYS